MRVQRDDRTESLQHVLVRQVHQRPAHPLPGAQQAGHAAQGAGKGGRAARQAVHVHAGADATSAGGTGGTAVGQPAPFAVGRVAGVHTARAPAPTRVSTAHGATARHRQEPQVPRPQVPSQRRRRRRPEEEQGRREQGQWQQRGRRLRRRRWKQEEQQPVWRRRRRNQSPESGRRRPEKEIEKTYGRRRQRWQRRQAAAATRRKGREKIGDWRSATTAVGTRRRCPDGYHGRCPVVDCRRGRRWRRRRRRRCGGGFGGHGSDRRVPTF